jgi:hypothetical protein
MKKAILFFSILISSTLFAQKEVHFYNMSAYDIYISYIFTTTNMDTDGSGSPKLSSVNPVIVTSGTTYSAIDASTSAPFRFPYNDFSGISSWMTSGGGTISSTIAYTVFGSGQKFYFAKVAVDDASLPIADGGNIGQDFGDSQSYIPGTYVDFYFVENYPDPVNNPNWIIYSILAI